MSRYQEELERHLEKYAGPIEIRHRNLLIVRANENRACHVVVTCDLSDQPMPAPNPEWQWAELCALLPPDWPLEPQIWENDPTWGWPMRELERLVEWTRASGDWLGFGHTVPNGEPPQPFAPSTQQCCSFLLPPVALPEKFARLRLKNAKILNFWAIVPITPGELALKMNQKAPSLIDRMGRKNISDVINPTRADVFQKSSEPKILKRWLLGR